MPRSFRSHVSSNLVGYIALFVALSGTAYAATELEKNEVKSKHIGKGQVKNADLANNAVTSPKVANGSLLGEDFAAGQLLPGPQGPEGPQGLQGERGPAGNTSCPSGTTRLGTTALCFEDSVRSALDFVGAAKTCSALNRTLPTIPDAQSVQRAAGAAGTIWSDVGYFNGASIVGVAVPASGNGTYAAGSSDYRCVVYASDR